MERKIRQVFRNQEFIRSYKIFFIEKFLSPFLLYNCSNLYLRAQ